MKGRNPGRFLSCRYHFRFPRRTLPEPEYPRLPRRPPQIENAVGRLRPVRCRLHFPFVDQNLFPNDDRSVLPAELRHRIANDELPAVRFHPPLPTTEQSTGLARAPMLTRTHADPGRSIEMRLRR